jgi:PKD repeat protein
VMDGSGNIGNQGADASVQRIRVNAAPIITLTEIDTTPGRPVELSAGVYDPDGDAPFSYRWDFGDGSAPGYGESPVHSYFHTDLINQETVYTMSLTVTDSGGKSAVMQATVKVHNTTSGRLYTDEHWSGTHTITGSILVPGGITLYTSPSTEVRVSGNPVDGYNHRITVEGTLLPGTGTSFSMTEGRNELWNGLYVRGQAGLSNVTIQNAHFALTITETAEITVTGSVFRNNETGIHILGRDSTITGCVFENNSVYAIKEDAGAEPHVTDCTFKNNLYDYYDDERTVISVEKLNLKPECSGNVKE